MLFVLFRNSGSQISLPLVGGDKGEGESPSPQPSPLEGEEVFLTFIECTK